MRRSAVGMVFEENTAPSGFGIRHSFVIRHSSLGIEFVMDTRQTLRRSTVPLAGRRLMGSFQRKIRSFLGFRIDFSVDWFLIFRIPRWMDIVFIGLVSHRTQGGTNNHGKGRS